MLANIGMKFKVLTGKVNPFKIKPEFCIFDGQKADKLQQTTAFFKNKTELDDQYDIIRLELTENQKCIGTTIGQYLQIQKQSQELVNKENNQQLKLWPISRLDDCGIVDFVVKKDKIIDIQQDEQFTITGPFTQYLYKGFGNLELVNQQNQEKQENQDQDKNYKKINVEYLGVISQNQYISDAMQIIEGIATNGDKTNLSVLHYCDNLDKASFLDELIWLREEQKINYSIFLNEVNKSFLGLKGIVNKDQIKDHLSPVIDGSIVMVAGNKQFTKEVNEYLKELQYNDEQILNVSNI